MTAVTLRINGAQVTRTVAPRTHLADFVREELGLTGTHLGCEHGVCGACTVVVDGRPVRSCLAFAVACSGSDVRTVEGFDDDPVMAQLRAAFSRRHALQCGYCTPGMLATAYDIVTRLPGADEPRIREELSGNLCRCTGYVGIVAAIRDLLAAGPHRSSVRSPTPPAPAQFAAFAGGHVAAAIDEETGFAIPRAIDGGVTLKRSLSVPANLDRLWATLQDIETVARCLPGAEIDAVKPDGSVDGAFTVAIGPMRARFRGRAQVAFDQAVHSGEIRGAGGDGASQSRAQGLIRFTARAAAGGASRLDIDMTYKLGGPLVQFGRPAVVAGVVDRLLGDFAANLARASQGEKISASAPVSGAGLVWSTLAALVRGLFSTRDRR
jgi:carbon-monoxide dehydrogenase small subunit